MMQVISQNTREKMKGLRYSGFGVYIQGIKSSLASRMAYRGDFIMSMFIMMIVELGGPVITPIYRTMVLLFQAGVYEVLLLQGIFLLSRGSLSHFLWE